MENLRFILAFAVMFEFFPNIESCQESLTTVSGTHAPVGKLCSGDIIFEDNFDELSLRIWQHENTLGSGNGEFQWYTNNRSNSYVENGILHIKPTFVADEFGNDFLYSGTLDINGGTPYEECTSPGNNGCVRKGTEKIILNSIKSARIRSLNSFAFKYGKVEVRAKVPSGDWLWPAIWMMPKWNTYSPSPASGEIDIMESRGNKQLYYWTGQNIGTEQITSTLHWGPNYQYDPYQYTHFQKNNDTGYDEDYHRYQLEWNPDNLTFLVDDRPIGTVVPPKGGLWELGGLDRSGLENPWRSSSCPMAPFDDEFYIILNLAVGGSTFPDFVIINFTGAKPWIQGSETAFRDFWEARNVWEPTWKLESDNSHFKIDHVKVWAL